jgi:hypothetical protein
MNSSDLNDPPTSVGGIPRSLRELFYRKDLNHPPTAVGGICDLDPPTAVGGMVLPKMPRRFLPVRVILFSALPIQMIGQSALPDLCRQL